MCYTGKHFRRFADSAVDNFNEVIDADLPPNLGMLMKNYVKLANRKPQFYHYNSHLKRVAHTIHYFGPIAYRFFKKHVTTTYT